MGATLILIDDYLRESKEEIRFQAREGFVLVEKGNQIRIERNAGEPLVLTLPKVGELDPNKQLRFALDAAVIWLFFFLAWSAFYLANQAQAEALGAKRRAAEAESAAQAAQVRALRYQVNPHFLFNTLNSLSSLVMAGRAEEAESMVLKLSTFFRSSLTLDATADISLAEEIALQRLYLDIEKVRFPRRLKAEIDIPEELETARLPALILQPIVENAIKHAVSLTRDKVELKIAAREAGPGPLHDRGQQQRRRPPGAGQEHQRSRRHRRRHRQRLPAPRGALRLARQLRIWPDRRTAAIGVRADPAAGSRPMADHAAQSPDRRRRAARRRAAAAAACADARASTWSAPRPTAKARCEWPRRWRPDVLLLDIAMPGLDGIGVARALAERTASPAVMFITAFDQFAVAAFEVEAVDYLMKPVEPARLQRALDRGRDYLERRETRPTVRAGEPRAICRNSGPPT